MPVAMMAIVGVAFGGLHPMIDAVAALCIGIYIFRNAYQIGRENVDYLMGCVPDKELLEAIRQQAADVNKVYDVRDIRAHYVGNFVHVEVEVMLDGELATYESHDVAEAVRRQIEALPAIDRAFVHVEPLPKQAPSLTERTP